MPQSPLWGFPSTTTTLQAPPQLRNPDPSTFERILDWAQRPVSATSGAALALQQGTSPLEAIGRSLQGLERHSWEDVLEESGMDEGWGRTIAGFTGDVFLDPLNLIPAAPVGKALGLTGSIGESLARQGGKLAKGLIHQSPGLEALGKKYIPYYGLPTPFRSKAQLLEANKRYVRNQAAEELAGTFGPLLKGAQDPAEAMLAAAKGVEAGRRGTPLERAVAEFGEQRAAREVPTRVLDKPRIENYVPHDWVEQVPPPAGRNIPTGGRPFFERPRAFSTYEQGQAAGYTPKPVLETMLKRQIKGESGALYKNFFQDLATNAEHAAYVAPASAAPKNWHAIGVHLPEDVKEIVSGVRVAPEVASYIDHIFKTSQDITGHRKAVQGLTNLWKTYVTSNMPGFHARNALSNVTLDMAGGMKATDVADRWGAAIGMLIPNSPLGQLEDARRFLPELEDIQRYGIIGTEFGVMGQLGDEATRIMQRAQGKGVNPLTRYTDLMRTVGTKVEDIGRLSLYIDKRLKGASVEDAALHVHKWMLNYADLGRDDVNLRILIPFWKWTRGVVPLLGETLLSRPDLFADFSKLREAMERRVPEDELVPQGQRHEAATRLGMVQQPDIEGKSVFRNLGFPGQELNLFPMSLNQAGESLQDLISMVNPLIKAPLEIAMNRNSFTRAPLYQISPAEPKNLSLQPLQELLGLGDVKAPAMIGHLLEQLLPHATTAGRFIGGIRGEDPRSVPLGEATGLPGIPDWVPRRAARLLPQPFTFFVEPPDLQRERLNRERNEARRLERMRR